MSSASYSTIVDSAFSMIPRDLGIILTIDFGALKLFCIESHLSSSLTKFAPSRCVKLADNRLFTILGSGEVKMTRVLFIKVPYTLQFPSTLLVVEKLSREMTCKVLFYLGLCAFLGLTN